MIRLSVSHWMTLAAALGTVVAHPTSAQTRVALDAQPVRVPVRAERLLARPVTLKVNQMPVRQAVNAVAAQARVTIGYQVELLDTLAQRVTMTAVEQPLGTVLDRILIGTRLRAVVTAADALMLEPTAAPVADGEIVGVVLQAKTKQPVVGARVVLDDATKGVATDETGTFRLRAASGVHTVSVRAVGFVKGSRRVTVNDNETIRIEFLLEPSTSVLDEVIVTGTVVATERKEIATPITVITAADIEKRGITRIDQLFRGEVPGVLALEQGSTVYNSGTLGAIAKSKVYARGSSSLDGSTNPLKTYIDGVELLDPSYLGTIDLSSIDRIEIVSGPQAATVYGSGAMGGVMQIFTKRGSGTKTDVTLNLKYGILENNIANGLTPIHNHGVGLSGGTGPDFSYSATASYTYSGQWQPELFSRTGGLSVGATHTHGAVTASGSFSTTAGENGTFTGDTPLARRARLTGAIGDYPIFGPTVISPVRSTSASQTAALNIDVRPVAMWQHHLTVGRNQSDFTLQPRAPTHMRPDDTLFYSQSSTGHRLTYGYNTTLLWPAGHALSSTLTLGVTGDQGVQTAVSGTVPTKTTSDLTNPYVTVSQNDRSVGGFGSWRIGLFDQLYLTFGVRGEQNPNYGHAHKIDWTPTDGIAYTKEVGDVTLKLLGSYGRATRAPNPEWRRQVVSIDPAADPARVVSQLASPNLTPEYSRGPQGGLEVYFGSVASFTVNRYHQTVDHLIQSIPVGDSIPRCYDFGFQYCEYFRPQQWVNVASMRQHGWEETASLTLGPLSFRGTYSWTDSRVTSVDPGGWSQYQPGQSLYGVPTHFGNVSMNYARAGTSVTLTTNYVGSILQNGTSGAHSYLLWGAPQVARIQMYVDRKRTVTTDYTQPGYLKSDLSISQRMTPWATFTMNVTNVGNSYGSEADYAMPALGRITTLGVSFRFPNSSR